MPYILEICRAGMDDRVPKILYRSVRDQGDPKKEKT